MHLAIRADGNSVIGFGHLVRTNALAQEFVDRSHEVTYLTTTPEAVATINDAQCGVVELADDPARIKQWVGKNGVDALLTDSFDIDTAYQRRLNELDVVLAVVLDDTRHTVACDVLVNGHVYAPALDYSWVGSKPTMCLGPEYLLLRDAFNDIASRKFPWHDPPETALVMMGGSDAKNTTPTVVDAFDKYDVDIDVIIGPGFENVPEIRAVVEETDATFSLHHDPDDLPELMQNADFAVSATGTTVYELLITRTPIIGLPQSDNQARIADACTKHDALLRTSEQRLSQTIGNLLASPNLRLDLRNRGKRLVDTRGSERLYRTIRQAVQSAD